MSSRINPWKQIGRPDYKGVHRMPLDIENRAVTHELNRQRVITQILLDLYCMVVVGLIPDGGRVELKGAGSQSLSGSKKDGTEAAHCAPRQILIGARRPQDILFEHFPERGFALNTLFAETDILPANFNKADSRAERNGLKDGFRLACQSILAVANLGGKLEHQNALAEIKKAYAIYRNRANDSFDDSIARLQKKLDDLKNSRIQFSILTDEKDKWQEQKAITEFYQEALRGTQGSSRVLGTHRLTGIFRIYNMIG